MLFVDDVADFSCGFLINGVARAFAAGEDLAGTAAGAGAGDAAGRDA